MSSPGNASREAPSQLQLQQSLKAAKAELAVEKAVREAAEQARDEAQNRVEEWKSAHASLQHRYEKRTKKCHALEKQNKALTARIEADKVRQERTIKENSVLKEQIVQVQGELSAAREIMKTGEPIIAEFELLRASAAGDALKNSVLERSLESTKKDFEFTRTQYQEASNKAVELASQVTQLESEATGLRQQASGEKLKLKERNYNDSVQRYLATMELLQTERRQRDSVIKKLEDEVKVLKRTRGGVQTRATSIQPGSPGPRSRAGSPASGLLSAPHSGNRASVLRHER